VLHLFRKVKECSLAYIEAEDEFWQNAVDGICITYPRFLIGTSGVRRHELLLSYG